MQKFSIEAKEKLLSDIFCDKYIFNIPSYQRPYAWTADQALELIDDLETACEASKEDNSSYFLGSIVLKKRPDDPNADVIDGQQRLTTITILLSVLRDITTDTEFSSSIHRFICQKGDPVLKTKDAFRLTLRSRDADFFCDTIQKQNSTSRLPDFKTQRDSRQRIIENASIFRSRIEKLTPDEQCALVQFIANQCYLVVVSTADEEAAFRIFSVLNSRGLSLTAADLLKAEIISALPEELHEKYTKKWEDIEDKLGREGFSELFAHIRMIYAKKKMRKTLIADFKENVLNVKNKNSTAPLKRADEFIDKQLSAYGNAYDVIKNCTYDCVDQNVKKEINCYFKFLNRLDNSDWLPPAIEAVNLHKEDVDFLQKFFKYFERLAYGHFIMRSTINQRISRYAELIGEIQKKETLFNENSPLFLRENEKKDIITILSGDIYNNKVIRLPVLLRLDEYLSKGNADYNYDTISVEHVLPQTADKIESWISNFPDEEQRNEWVHKLANLVLLNRRTNTSAQNYDFETKKEKYFCTKNGVCNFALTTQVLNHSDWTPAILEERQKELLSDFAELWGL